MIHVLEPIHNPQVLKNDRNASVVVATSRVAYFIPRAYAGTSARWPGHTYGEFGTNGAEWTKNVEIRTDGLEDT